MNHHINGTARSDEDVGVEVRQYPDLETAYKDWVKRYGQDFADESLKVHKLLAEGKMTDWETVDFGMEYSRNGQRDAVLLNNAEAVPVSDTFSSNPTSPSTNSD